MGSSTAMEETRLKPIARRAFKKSRLGCRNCKARRVKCDEKHPRCGNCSRHFLNLDSCEYDVFITPSSSQTPRISPPQSPSTQIRSQMNSTCTPRSLEPRLLHHYITLTSSQMPPGGKETWTVDLPKLGFQSDQVLDAILGISAQHLWALVPHERNLAHASRYYLDRAILQHKSALAQADQRSAESLLATAILITHHVWTAAHSEDLDGGSYLLPLQTYHMARGIVALSDQLFPRLKGSRYLWYVEQTLEAPDHESHHHVCWNDGERDLQTMAVFLEQSSLKPSDIRVCLAALGELRSMYNAIRAGHPQPLLQRMVATMPIRLPTRFLELVEEHQPFALATLARNLALLKVIEKVWWLHGAGDHEVAEHAVRGICGLLPLTWKWAANWPLKVVSGEITIDD